MSAAQGTVRTDLLSDRERLELARELRASEERQAEQQRIAEREDRADRVRADRLRWLQQRLDHARDWLKALEEANRVLERRIADAQDAVRAAKGYEVTHHQTLRHDAERMLHEVEHGATDHGLGDLAALLSTLGVEVPPGAGPIAYGRRQVARLAEELLEEIEVLAGA